MKTKLLFLLSILSFTLLFNSCGKEDTIVEIGKEFKIDENPITILKLEEAKALRSAKEELVQIAPKGKKYIYLEVKNPNDEMIFLKTIYKEQELEQEELFDYGHDMDTGFEDAYYLVDENATVDKIIIATPSDERFTVLKPTMTKSKFLISEEAQKIIDSYSEEKAIGLLEGFAPYVKDGKSVFDIATQEGSDLPSNIMSNKAEVIYFTEDGKKYIFNITDIFGGKTKVTSYWEDGKIVGIEVLE